MRSYRFDFSRIDEFVRPEKDKINHLLSRMHVPADA